MDYIAPKPPNKWTYILFAMIIAMIIASLAGCSSTYHYKMILKKDPDFFRTDTTTHRDLIKTPAVHTSFDCLELLRSDGPLVLDIPIRPTDNTQTPVRFVKLSLTASDSANIQAMVECPPTEIITKYVPEPYPVQVPITWKQKIKYGATGLITLVLILFVVWLIKGVL